MIDNLVAVCGVSCTLCEVYPATVHNDRVELERIAAEWTKAFGQTFTADDIICDGCRVPDARHCSPWEGCEIRLCSEEKGLPTCAHCADSPCEKIVSPVAREAQAELKKFLQQ